MHESAHFHARKAPFARHVRSVPLAPPPPVFSGEKGRSAACPLFGVPADAHVFSRERLPVHQGGDLLPSAPSPAPCIDPHRPAPTAELPGPRARDRAAWAARALSASWAAPWSERPRAWVAEDGFPVFSPCRLSSCFFFRRLFSAVQSFGAAARVLAVFRPS